MIKYLFEIKNRVLLLILLWIFVGLVCYYYKEVLLFSFIKSFICLNSDLFYFIFTNVTEIFFVYFNIITFISFQIACWYLIYHIFVFLSPALFRNEHQYLDFFFKLLTFFFFISFVLSNYVLIPLTWHYFLSFKPIFFAKSVYFEARLSEYLNFYINVYSFGFVYCQIFSVLFFFLSDIYSKKSFIKIKKFRKLYYYVFVIFSTLVSPPEVITQAIMSLSLLVAYEFILFIWMYFVCLIKLIRQQIKTN
jgi:sec-independent protein translocase protein TatC